MNHPIFIIAGAAIMDVLARPVDPSVFRTGSIPAKGITMRTGGDAMNEAKALSSLGNPVRLISKLGRDTAGERSWRNAPCPTLTRAASAVPVISLQV